MFNRFIDWFCNKIWPLVDSQRQILGIQLDITNACNLACVHCYHPHHKNQGALTYEQWLQVLEQYKQLLKKLRMKPSITICGGEPLLCSFLIPLLENIRKYFPFCDLSIQTNGTVLTFDQVVSFKKLNVSIQISIDGPNSQSHDLIRGDGSFKKSLDGCHLLKTHSIPFWFLAILSEKTAPWIPDFFKLAITAGASAMNFTRLVIEGYAKQLFTLNVDRPLEGKHLKKALKDILEYSREYNVPTETRGALWHLIDREIGSPNNVGFAGLIISYKGEFKVTSRASMVLGNVLHEGIEKLFLFHPIMQRLRKGKIEGCGQCRFFDRCRGDR
ncbi:MAG: radical SAM protein, partial [Deltaproteobacteria bacterium]|nr:radical SAM protein [Deltaproteobacteria bacterium]